MDVSLPLSINLNHIAACSTQPVKKKRFPHVCLMCRQNMYRNNRQMKNGIEFNKYGDWHRTQPNIRGPQCTLFSCIFLNFLLDLFTEKYFLIGIDFGSTLRMKFRTNSPPIVISKKMSKSIAINFNRVFCCQYHKCDSIVISIFVWSILNVNTSHVAQ